MTAYLVWICDRCNTEHNGPIDGDGPAGWLTYHQLLTHRAEHDNEPMHACPGCLTSAETELAATQRRVRDLARQWQRTKLEDR
jgi:hypothetical protein